MYMEAKDAKFYRQNINQMPHRDIQEVLEQNPFKWKEEARILDIGCGDGSLSMNILKPHLPKGFKKYVGCDINPNVVNYVKEKYGSERIQFKTLDIQGDVPGEMVGSFDHVFSSYTFHWVGRQVAAFTNVYNMLAEGGSCLIVFLQSHSIFQVFKRVSHMPKWSNDLKDVDSKFVLPYNDSPDQPGDVRKVMENVGFKDVEVKLIPKTYIYGDLDEFQALIRLLNPFNSLEEKWDDFIDDCARLGLHKETVNYKLFEARGSK